MSLYLNKDVCMPSKKSLFAALFDSSFYCPIFESYDFMLKFVLGANICVLFWDSSHYLNHENWDSL